MVHFGFRKVVNLATILEDAKKAEEIRRGFAIIEVHGKSFQLVKKSLYVFTEKNDLLYQIRFWCVWLTEWWWFQHAIIVLILVNSAMLVLPLTYDPAHATDEQKNTSYTINFVTVFIFAVEAILRIIARGLVFGKAPEKMFLQEPLNWIDIVVVLSGLIELFFYQGESSNNSTTGFFVILRCTRVLRPLRSIKSIPSLRALVLALGDSLVPLGNWILVICFMYVAWIVAGSSLFSDVYWRRCRLTAAPYNDASGALIWPIDHEQTRFCSGRYSCQATSWGNQTYCGSPVTQNGIIDGYDPWPEVYNASITDYGYTGFQSFFPGLLTTFEVASVDGWTTLLYRYQDGDGDFVPLCFYCALVLFGGLLIMKVV